MSYALQNHSIGMIKLMRASARNQPRHWTNLILAMLCFEPLVQPTCAAPARNTPPEESARAQTHQAQKHQTQQTQAQTQAQTQGQAEAKAYFLQAQKCLNSGASQEQALTLINKAIAITPGNSDYHFTKSVLLFALEEDEEALKEANEAIRLNSANTAAYFIKARAVTRLGRGQEGLALMNQVLAKDPHNGAYLDTRGRIFNALEQYPQAKADFIAAIKLAPENDKPHWDLMNLLEKMQDWQGLVNEADILIKVANDPTMRILRARARAYTKLKQYDKAIADLKLAIKAWPDEMKAHTQLLNTYKLKGDVQGAAAEQHFIDKLNLELTGHK